MKIGEKEIKITSDQIIDGSVVVLNIGVDFCVKKVVKEIIKHSLPEPTKTGQKIIFKIGEYAFTAAIGTVVADKFTSIGNLIKSTVKEIKELKKLEEVDLNGSGEPEAEQQQVQEGE